MTVPEAISWTVCPAACTRPSLPSGDATCASLRIPAAHHASPGCLFDISIIKHILPGAATIHASIRVRRSGRYQWPWLHDALHNYRHSPNICSHQPRCTAHLVPVSALYCKNANYVGFSRQPTYALRAAFSSNRISDPCKLSPLNHFPDQSHTPAWRLRYVVNLFPLCMALLGKRGCCNLGAESPVDENPSRFSPKGVGRSNRCSC
jgi:hypothetical protein